jgi:hypothetical protein
MTRQQRLATKEAALHQHLKDQQAALYTQLAATRKHIAQVQSAQRAEERKARTKREAHIGHLAAQAGLLAWDDATLANAFAFLAELSQAPNPVALLDVVLRDLREVPPHD